MNKDLVIKNKEKVRILKQNGELEYFDEHKLRSSLERSRASKQSISEVLNRIESEIEDGMSTSKIYQKAFSILEKVERRAAASYSLRKAVMDLGPTGFPFEKFVGKVLESKGFKVEVDKIVMGSCVPHEVDVVAYNDKKLIMAEAKFHNEHGTKSDLKVALYVKARFDDIRGNMFVYGGRKRALDEGWLVTNTKFSSTALDYGVCKGLKMIGWNYPEKGNLQDMIEESGVHPLTCLKSLTNNQKKLLLNQGHVLCRKVVEDPEALKSIGLASGKIEKIHQEVRSVCYT